MPTERQHFIKMYKYLTFVEVDNLKGTTRKFECKNNNSQTVLGIVKWYAPWRQYCYFDERAAVYSAGCLDDVADFLREVNRK